MSYVRLWCEPRHAWEKGYTLNANSMDTVVPVDPAQFTDRDEWEVFVDNLDFPDGKKRTMSPWPVFRHSVVPLTLAAARELIASDVRRLKLKRYEQ